MNLKQKIVTIMFLLFCPVGVWAQNEAANTGRIKLDVEVLDNLGFDTVTEIVTLQNATASEIEPLVSSRLSRYGAVQVNDTLNMLIITDKPLKVKDLAELARKLDTPGDAKLSAIGNRVHRVEIHQSGNCKTVVAFAAFRRG